MRYYKLVWYEQSFCIFYYASIVGPGHVSLSAWSRFDEASFNFLLDGPTDHKHIPKEDQVLDMWDVQAVGYVVANTENYIHMHVAGQIDFKGNTCCFALWQGPKLIKNWSVPLLQINFFLEWSNKLKNGTSLTFNQLALDHELSKRQSRRAERKPSVASRERAWWGIERLRFSRIEYFI